MIRITCLLIRDYMKQKLILAILILSSFLFPLSFSVATVQAQELPDFVIKAVAEVSVYKDIPFTVEENKVKQGSGVFVDHGGCLFTNSHVVLNLETDEVYPHIVVRVSENRAKPPIYIFEGELIYVQQELDLAYVCPKEKTTIFTHFFERFNEPIYDEVPFGKEIWILGYPAAGESTITVAPGHVVGFLDQPDLSKWYGIPDLNESRLRLYKTDGLSGPGVSGGVLIDENLRLMGVPFAGTTIPGAFIFSLSEEVYQQFQTELRNELHASGRVPLDCVFDAKSEYYYQSGVAFYDEQCSFTLDEAMEQEVKQTYRAFCGEEISIQRLIPAVRRSKQLGDLSKWSDNLEAICPKEQTIIGDKALEDRELSAGDFAYGKARLSSLEQEQALAESLKSEIDKNFPQLQIHANDWSTVVNSYIYGGYSITDINRAIELGGKTVHPTIPFQLWQGSADYQLNR